MRSLITTLVLRSILVAYGLEEVLLSPFLQEIRSIHRRDFLSIALLSSNIEKELLRLPTYLLGFLEFLLIHRLL